MSVQPLPTIWCCMCKTSIGGFLVRGIDAIAVCTKCHEILSSAVKISSLKSVKEAMERLAPENIGHPGATRG